MANFDNVYGASVATSCSLLKCLGRDLGLFHKKSLFVWGPGSLAIDLTS